MARLHQKNNTESTRAPVNRDQNNDIQKRKPVDEKQGGIMSWKKTKKTSTKEFVQQIPALGQNYGIGKNGKITAETVATTSTRRVTRSNPTTNVNTTNDENVCMICFVCG